MIKAAEANVAAVSRKTIVIPGHNMPGHASPVSNKTELVAFRDMLVAIRANVAKLKQQGHSLDEAIAAKPTAAFDATWGQFLHHSGILCQTGLRGRLTPHRQIAP
jgi:hypothetical protein